MCDSEDTPHIMNVMKSKGLVACPCVRVSVRARGVCRLTLPFLALGVGFDGCATPSADDLAI